MFRLSTFVVVGLVEGVRGRWTKLTHFHFKTSTSLQSGFREG